MSEDLKSYKWLVSSCLQKSLRRGRFDLAQSYVRFLWEHDRNYLTYRFGTILTEDVGIANQELVSKYLDTKLAKKTIDTLGGVDFIIQLTQEACLSVKDRSSCDAAYLASYFKSDIDTKENAISIFKDSSQNYISRINASWAILGNKKFKNDHLKFFNTDKDDLEGYIGLVEQITNPQFSKLTKNAYSTQVENIFLGLPVVQTIYQNELLQNSHSKLRAGKTIENTYVKEQIFHHATTGLELISCGLDGHTREGKSVYYNFLKSNSEFKKYMNFHKVAYSDHITLLTHCMFRIEGHEVNKRLYFPTAVTVMRDCEEKILNMKAGLSEGTLKFSELRKIILDSMGSINQMRQDGLNNLPSWVPKNKI